MRVGADHVFPPSVDLERATADCPVKRLSCQTTYNAPLVASTAISWMMSPVRTGAPVVGSVTEVRATLLTVVGPDQVAPLSVERSTATLTPRTLWAFLKLKISMKESTSVPSGSTTIW